MAYSFRHTRPELAGVIIKEKVRCGKQNCRCVRVGKLHKWYYYLYWRDYGNGKILRKKYIPRTDVRKLRQKIKVAKYKDMGEKFTLRSYIKLLKQLI